MKMVTTALFLIKPEPIKRGFFLHTKKITKMLQYINNIKSMFLTQQLQECYIKHHYIIIRLELLQNMDIMRLICHPVEKQY